MQYTLRIITMDGERTGDSGSKIGYVNQIEISCG